MINVKSTLTYKALAIFGHSLKDFLITLGNVGKDFSRVFYYILKLRINVKATIEQSSRFAVDSLPITLTIVSMTSIIIAMQIAPELAKQGAEGYIGMLSALVMVRELACIMSGFAIISMIGSAYASEIATMRVTEQVDALKVLKVNPVDYLFVPRTVAGFIMMPFVVIIASAFGLVCGGVAAFLSAHVSRLNYISSLWQGLYIKDISVALAKAACFGAAIAIISSTCGYLAYGGAKGVGISTTKAVVWSFVAICIIDYIFATIFFF